MPGLPRSHKELTSALAYNSKSFLPWDQDFEIYLSNTHNNHNKFYRISYKYKEGIYIYRTWGRIGTEQHPAGDSSATYALSEAERARKDVLKILRQKISKGYVYNPNMSSPEPFQISIKEPKDVTSLQDELKDLIFE